MKRENEYKLEWCEKCRVVFAFNTRTGDGKCCPTCHSGLYPIGTYVNKHRLPVQHRSPRMPNVKPPREEPSIMEFMRKKRI